ncbi:hypothetical protein RI129_003385 [Pyrocoelia pectoralis]|uniref:Cytochrome P450 n=1 Tax=Pyrocoelia pectoralis TaxID=417401 RepID=A0AAN7VRG7_9COLE
MLVLFIVLISFIPLFAIYTFLENRRRNELLSKIPGLSSVPIVGALFNFTKPSDELWMLLRKNAVQYFPIYKFWILNVPVVVLLSPEDIEIILSSPKHITKTRIYNVLHSWLGRGLLTSNGTKWHIRRKMLTPTFHFHILEQFMETFVEQSAEIVNKLELECEKPWTDVVPVVAEYTLNSICESAMGTRMNNESKIYKRYTQSVERYILHNDSLLFTISYRSYRIGEIYLYIVTHPWCRFPPTFIFTPTYWTLKKLVKILHSFSSSIIQKRKKTFKISNLLSKGTTKPKKRLAMLDLLISAMNSGQPINDKGIQEEVDTFIFEGHDTTSASISFTLLMLACHRNVQQKVVDEIEEIFGNTDRDPSYQNFKNLPYLEQVLKESLRMYPSVPFITRLTNEEIETHSGYILPKNTKIHIHIYDLHHNPKIYPDPYKFDPERFNAVNSKHRHPFAYIPFSAGPRNCIGQRFAYLEMKVVLVAILRRFVLEPVDFPKDISLMVHLILRSKNGVKVKFRRREINKFN